jgi:hypothetical protein
MKGGCGIGWRGSGGGMVCGTLVLMPAHCGLPDRQCLTGLMAFDVKPCGTCGTHDRETREMRKSKEIGVL